MKALAIPVSLSFLLLSLDAFAQPQSGTLIQIPFCEEWIQPFEGDFQMRQPDGSNCQGWSCITSWSMRPTSGNPSTLDWSHTVTAYQLLREDCLCGPGNIKECVSHPNPSYLVLRINQNDWLQPLLQLTGEVTNIASNVDIRGSITLSTEAFWVTTPWEQAPSLLLALQRFDNGRWIDVSQTTAIFDGVTNISGTVPGNSQIRMELRSLIKGGSFGLDLRVYDATLFGAQCFPSPNPDGAMCQ
jgi:hypothetical protein